METLYLLSSSSEVRSSVLKPKNGIDGIRESKSFFRRERGATKML